MAAETADGLRPAVTATAEAAATVPSADGAPLLIGVIGKRGIHGLDDPLRAAFERCFDELDRRLPHTPKILMSGLAIGADTVAAEAAVGRTGWRVVAPLPFRRDLYEADFKSPEDLQRLRTLTSDPRVHVVELAPLRRPGSAEAYADHELRRATPSPPHRTLHYEQAGLFIVERSALLIAVVDAHDGRGRVGGTDRMLETRLSGPDAIARDARARSDVLLREGGLVDARTGPAWSIALDGPRPELPIMVHLPDGTQPEPLGRGRATAASLALGRRLDELNRRSATLLRSGLPPGGDASARLSELRGRLTVVQARMKARVRRSVWTIALLFALAIFALEGHIALAHYPWSRAFALAHFAFAAAAVTLYVWAASRRWQPLAEDYRAVAEALRTQIVVWSAGLEKPGGRVDLGYLRGMKDAFAEVRDTAGQLVEGVRLRSSPASPNPEAVRLWLEGQLEYFRNRIARHRLAVSRTHVVSWFLFVFGLAMSACIAATQAPFLDRIFAGVVEADMSPARRWAWLVGELIVVGAMFAGVWQTRVGVDHAPRSGALAWIRRFSLPVTAALAGLIMARALCDVAALMPEPRPALGVDLQGFRVRQARDLMVMCAITAAAIAGAIRFVADKLSLEAELQGFEHAEAYFARARDGLRQLAGGGPAAERQRDEILSELVEEALRENESWLFAHRERPLEPIVGG